MVNESEVGDKDKEKPAEDNPQPEAPNNENDFLVE